LFVECQFHGAVHAHANLFSNIDTVLRGRGFSLCDLEINRYTRRALPGKFRGNLAAETIRGQVLWADALYLRDYVAAGNADRWGVLSTEKILKLACLFELYGLFDCSAELLIGCRGEMPDGLPVDGWLDILAEELRPGCGGFARLSRQFEKNPELAYPSKAESAPRSTRWLSRVFRRLARGS
jgi:hypothetical protein